MGLKMDKKAFNQALSSLQKKYVIYGPKRFVGEGTFSDTDSIRYGEISTIEDMELKEKSLFSPKEVLLPITQTLFYFTENETKEADMNQQDLLVILRSCDLHAVKRMDEIYLRNGCEDIYYKKYRDRVKFMVLGCAHSFENCFCVDMKTNKSDHYDAYFHCDEAFVYVDVKCLALAEAFKHVEAKTEKLELQFVKENKKHVNIPDNLDTRVFKSSMWDEYSERCIACGRCNFACPTCTCFTMQDVFYKDNEKAGERRRVWASCQVNGFTDMAGGHSFRPKNGQKMRFKVMHKIYDYKKRFGYHMCVGCGRCDDICPEYISITGCINKLEKAMEEVE
ncbi:MAG: anaerobic sulfite reductase subunit AsrA [Turicibacter sp.]